MKMQTNNTYAFWAHGQSGEVFAVRLDGSDRIDGCYGPLLSRDIRDRELPRYPYSTDPGALAWIERHRENWAPSELAYPPHY